MVALFLNLQPDYFVGSVRELSPEFLLEHGCNTIIFDIDNTLVSHDTPHPTQEVINFLRNFSKSGIKIALVSNNSKERVETFSRDLHIFYLPRAYKPFKRGLKRVLRELEAVPGETALAGDQLFTDIWGGNRMGFYTILVTPIKENETWFVALKRRFEKIFLKNQKN